jgi:hypothetical protein
MSMKKFVSFIAVIALAGLVNADTFTWSSSVLTTSTQVEVSADLPVSGTLIKIEAWSGAIGLQTSTVTLASYAGSTAIDTYATLTVPGTGTNYKVAYPRRVGTGSTGVNLTSAIGVGENTNTTQILVVPYEPIMLGGNTRIRVSQLAEAVTTNTITVRLFFKRD